MLHVVYRSYGGENAKGRPPFYSKLNALLSLVRAAEPLGADSELLFLNDGPIPADRLRVMERSGEVLAHSNLGGRGSMRVALALPEARGWNADDLVWFAEDDYLYLADSLVGLNAASRVFPDAAYFALYALIGDRLPNGAASDDARIPAGWRSTEPRLVQDHPWRRALSTTSTFGARVGPLLEDDLLMRLAIASGGAWDHTSCLLYQGFAPYPIHAVLDMLRNAVGLKDFARRAAISAARLGLNGYRAARAAVGRAPRLLIAADPPLATHLESAYLALGTDWSTIAAETAHWATERVLI